MGGFVAGIFQTATNIATPLGLAGLFGAIFLLILREVVNRAVPKPEDSTRVVLHTINLLFALCLVGMLLGFVGYALKVGSEREEKRHAAVPSSSVAGVVSAA